MQQAIMQNTFWCYFVKRENNVPKFPIQCKSRSGTIGTWYHRLFVTATLARPDMVGWSGILARKISRWFLNYVKLPEFSFLRGFGSRLNNWTLRNFSLACFSFREAFLWMLAVTASLPLLSLHCHLMSNPLISPWEIFHIQQIWYLCSALLRANSQHTKFLPLTSSLQNWVFHLGDKVFLYRLHQVVPG